MTADIHFYEPAQGHGLRHNPLNAIIAPRPIGWISTRDAGGTLNLAPYSFFNAFNYVPPIIGFSSTARRDSLRNIEATGEFCWNLATRELAQAMNLSSSPVPPEVDEFALAGMTPAPSRIVSAPRVAESPVSFECRLSQIVRLRGADGRELDAWLTLGEVVGVHIERRLIKDGVYDTVAGAPIVRGGAADEYFAIDAGALFRMARPD